MDMNRYVQCVHDQKNLTLDLTLSAALGSPLACINCGTISIWPSRDAISKGVSWSYKIVTNPKKII